MLADNVPAVQALGQCIFLPMLIIGGVAVPLASLPVWAQHVSAFFPGRYAVDALQSSVTGGGLTAAGFSLLALLLIGAAGCLAGAKMFRWDAEQRFAARARQGLARSRARGVDDRRAPRRNSQQLSDRRADAAGAGAADADRHRARGDSDRAGRFSRRPPCLARRRRIHQPPLRRTHRRPRRHVRRPRRQRPPRRRLRRMPARPLRRRAPPSSRPGPRPGRP